VNTIKRKLPGPVLRIAELPGLLGPEV